METDAAREFLEIVIDYAHDLQFVRKFGGEEEREFIFRQAAEIIEAHPVLKNSILEKVGTTISGYLDPLVNRAERPVELMPRDLILYLANRFRWEELRAIANAHLEGLSLTDSSMKNYDWANSLLAALEDDWASARLYETLSE